MQSKSRMNRLSVFRLTEAIGPDMKGDAGAVASTSKADPIEENVLITKPYNLEYELQVRREISPLCQSLLGRTSV